ncbi:MAG: membrane protein insertion efficiency factor YidD [Bacteroidaceae bacterium]|nr:membrane protein insertion efficiency factor YidD [Bacteroidaceae bacterium]
MYNRIKKVVANDLIKPLHLVALLIFYCHTSYAQITPHITETQHDTTTISAGDDYIQFYQDYISNQKNSNCAMYPSCSDYGRMVVKEKNILEAMTLIAERLSRCSHDKHFYKTTSFNGMDKCLDFPHDSLNHNVQDKTLYTDIISDKQKPLAFINHLINCGDYEGAMFEVRKEMFYHPTLDLYKPKLICYRALNKPAEAVFEFETTFPDAAKIMPDVNYQGALAYYDLENYKDLRRTLDICLNNPSDSSMLERMYALKAMSYVQEEAYDSATNAFQDMYRWGKNEALHHKNVDKINLLVNQPQKSPNLARALSFIPGLGYLYTGHKGSALTSFIINSALGYATYSCFKEKVHGLGILCCFLNASFYIGNLNGAYKSAIRHNHTKKQNVVKHLEAQNQILLTY